MKLCCTKFHLSAREQTQDDFSMIPTSVNKKAIINRPCFSSSKITKWPQRSHETTTLGQVLYEVLGKQRPKRQGQISRSFPTKPINHPLQRTGNRQRGRCEGQRTAIRVWLLTSSHVWREINTHSKKKKYIAKSPIWSYSGVQLNQHFRAEVKYISV